jgi:hypothetical protein
MKHHSIQSENSEYHWLYFNPKEKIVLDLGCGRHDTNQVEHHSPTYFLQQGALKVLAIDSRQSEVDYFNSLNLENLEVRSMFIDNTDIVRNLLNESKATALKCDIEEWEKVLYGLDKKDMEQVTDLAIEYHTEEIREHIIAKMNEWGFNIIAEGKFGFVHAPQMGVLFAEK